jgi:hypothetical protein
MEAVMKRVLAVVGILAAVAGLSATAMAMDNAPTGPTHNRAACAVATFVMEHPGQFGNDAVSSSYDFWRNNCQTNDTGL